MWVGLSTLVGADGTGPVSTSGDEADGGTKEGKLTVLASSAIRKDHVHHLCMVAVHV